MAATSQNWARHTLRYLPTELQIQLLAEYLDFESILQLRATSRHFRDLTQTAPALKALARRYQLEFLPASWDELQAAHDRKIYSPRCSRYHLPLDCAALAAETGDLPTIKEVLQRTDPAQIAFTYYIIVAVVLDANNFELATKLLRWRRRYDLPVDDLLASAALNRNAAATAFLLRQIRNYTIKAIREAAEIAVSQDDVSTFQVLVSRLRKKRHRKALQTLITTVLLYDRVDFVEYLLQQRLTTADQLLVEAAGLGALKAARRLLEWDTGTLSRARQEAVERGDLEMVRLLSPLPSQINQVLLMAVLADQPELARALYRETVITARTVNLVLEAAVSLSDADFFLILLQDPRITDRSLQLAWDQMAEWGTLDNYLTLQQDPRTQPDQTGQFLLDLVAQPNLDRVWQFLPAVLDQPLLTPGAVMAALDELSHQEAPDPAIFAALLQDNRISAAALTQLLTSLVDHPTPQTLELVRLLVRDGRVTLGDLLLLLSQTELASPVDEILRDRVQEMEEL